MKLPPAESTSVAREVVGFLSVAVVVLMFAWGLVQVAALTTAIFWRAFHWWYNLLG